MLPGKALPKKSDMKKTGFAGFFVFTSARQIRLRYPPNLATSHTLVQQHRGMLLLLPDQHHG